MCKNDGLEKKKKKLYFHIREVRSHSREYGSRAAFPGGSRMIREGSHVCLRRLSSSSVVVVRRRPHSLNIFSSETMGLIKVKFHMKPPWDGGTEVCSNGPGHMTKMATTPIYGKNKIFSGTKRPMILKLGMQHWVLKYYQVCLKDGPGSTLTYFTARSNLVPYAFVWEKGKTMDFSETIVVCVIKAGICSQINEYMNLHEYQRSKLFIDLCPRSLRFNIFKNLFP